MVAHLFSKDLSLGRYSFSHTNEVNTVNMVNGVHRTSDANEVRNLIALHNTTNDNKEYL